MRALHRRFERVRRVEADVPLIEPERILDAVHHVADADDAGERHGVEVGDIRGWYSGSRGSGFQGSGFRPRAFVVR